MDLTKLSDSELEAELTRREEARKALKAAALLTRQRWLLANIDTLLSNAFVPQHDRTSCSDTNIVNSRRCRRCALIRCKNLGYIDDLDFRFDLRFLD